MLASLSGIFRDSFENVLNLLDKLFETVATADEPEELNFIRKHSREMKGTTSFMELSAPVYFDAKYAHEASSVTDVHMSILPQATKSLWGN